MDMRFVKSVSAGAKDRGKTAAKARPQIRAEFQIHRRIGESHCVAAGPLDTDKIECVAARMFRDFSGIAPIAATALIAASHGQELYRACTLFKEPGALLAQPVGQGASHGAVQKRGRRQRHPAAVFQIDRIQSDRRIDAAIRRLGEGGAPLASENP